MKSNSRIKALYLFTACALFLRMQAAETAPPAAILPPNGETTNSLPKTAPAKPETGNAKPETSSATPASTGTTAPAKPVITAGVQKSDYGKTADGAAVELYTLTNRNGAVAKIITYGATIVDLEMPDRDGKFANVVLATPTPASFLTFNQPASVMGRVANRIAGAAFTLDGHDYKLTANDGPNTLHSGNTGFNKVVWTAEIPDSNKKAGSVVKLTYVSKDGDLGFPGNLTTSVTYTLTDQNVFRLEYSATTDKSTPINFTNHAYFNLAGGKGDSSNYEVMINADRYTVADAALIPTGEIAPVKDTAMDFTKPMALGARATQLGVNAHYDHSFVLNRDKDVGAALAFAARVSEPTSGRVIEAWTTEPGLQLYTSTLSATAAAGTAAAPVSRPGRGAPRAGFFTLETQHFPDSIHHANFPNTILHPGETFTSTTEYRFSAM